MSRTIDERVVEMRFDNKHFESNVATSMSTLEKLKRSLKLDGATKGLEEIDSAAKRVDMTGLGGAVETVKAKFSALDVVAVTALANITNSAVNAGKRLVSSLTIDQVASGWNKFEQKTSSVQTIMNSTGKSIEEVNGYLDKLMWYSDETSYGFTDMTSSLAQLTSAGGDINKLIPMIEGIANSVAFAGKGAAEFSRAIYNLNQSYSMGALQYMDWKSLELAGAGSKQLKQMFIDTAIALGKLSEAGKTANGTLVTTANFTQTLSQKWADTEVMEQAFGRFAVVTEAAYDIVQDSSNKIDTATVAYKVLSGELDETSEEYLSMSEAHKALVGTFSEVEIAAAKSAQEAKTFTEAIDATKDAVSSGWMRSVENMFGNYEQAKKLWSDVCEQLWDIFAAGGERRNDILYETMSSSWDKLSDAVKDTGISTEAFNEAVIATAKDHGIKIDELIKKYGSLGDVISSGRLSKDIVFEAVAGLTPTFKSVTGLLDLATDKLEHFQNVVNKVINGDFGSGEELTKALTDAGENVVAIQTLVNGIWDETNGTWSDTTITAADLAFVLGEMSEEELKNIGYTEEQAASLKKLAKQSEDSWESMNKLIEDLYKPSGRELLFSTIHNTLASISNIIWSFRDGWAEVFPEERVANGTYNALVKVETASKKVFEYVDENYDKLVRIFKGIASLFDAVTTFLGGGIKIAFKVLSQVLSYFNYDVLELAASLGDSLVKFKEWFDELFDISGILDMVVPLVEKGVTAVTKWFNAFQMSEGMQNAIKYIQDIGDGIKEWWADLENAEDLPRTIAEGIVNFFSNIPTIISTVASNIWSAFTSTISNSGNNPLDSLFGDISYYADLAWRTAVELGKILLDKLNDTLTAHGFKAISYDAIAGLAQGLRDGASAAWDAAVTMAMELVQKVKDFLGIHSPSTVFAAIGGFIVAGLVMGLKNGSSDILKSIQSIFEPFIEWASTLDFGKALGAFLSFSTIAVVFKGLKVLDKLVSPLEGLGRVFDSVSKLVTDCSKNINKILKATSNVLNGVAWDLKAEAIKKFAISIAILAASIWVLATIDDTGKLWSAVGAIAVLVAVMAGLAWAMSKLESASVGIDAKTKKINFKGIQTLLLQIGFSLLMIAASVAIIGKLKPDQMKQGITALAEILVGVVVLIGVLAGVSKIPGDFGGLGKMMFNISASLLILAVVMRMLGGMSPEDILTGIFVMEAFMLFCIELGLANRLAGSIDNGASFLKMAAGLAAMAIVVKIISGMDPADIIVGVAAMQAFVILIGEMALINKVAGDVTGNTGSTVIKLAGSMLILAGVALILSQLEEEDVARGISYVQKFMLLISELVLVSRLAGKESADISKNLLAMSIAIAVLAGTCVLIGLVPDGVLEKGLNIVYALGLLMSALILSTRGTQDASKNLLGIMGALLIMVGCVALLCWLQEKSDVTQAVGALAAIMISFGVMGKLLQSTKIDAGVGKSLLVMTGVILVLTGVLALLSLLPNPDTILPTAVGLSAILLAMSLACAIASKIPVGAGLAGAIELAEFIGVMALVVAAAGALSLIPGIDSFLNGGAEVLGAIGLAIGRFVGGIVEGVATGVFNALPAFGTALSDFMTNIQPFIEMASNVDANAVLGAGYIAATILVLSAASFISGIMSILSLGAGSLSNMGNQLKALGEGASAFFGTVQNVDSSAVTAAKNVADMLLALTASEFLATLTEKFGGSVDFGSMGKNLNTFGEAVVGFSETISGKVDAGAVEAASKAGTMLAELNKSLPRTGGWLQDVIGEQDFEKFATACRAFAECIIGINEAVSREGFEINDEQIEKLTKAGTQFSELYNSLPRSGGLLQDFLGNQDLEAFGTAVESFSECMLRVNDAISQNGFDINEDKINKLTKAGTKFSELYNSLPKSGGKLQEFLGNEDLKSFGSAVEGFAACMIRVNAAVSQEGFEVNLDAIEDLRLAGEKMKDLQSTLPKDGGWWQDVAGSSDIGEFGEKIGNFASAIVDFSNSSSGLNNEGISLAIDTAERIRDLIISLSDFDMSGLPKFIGAGSDGAVQKVAKAITEYSNEVAGINTEAVSVSVSAARDIKSLINTLPSLDTSGIANFKPDLVGVAIKNYADKVTGINWSEVASSTASAKNLKILIASLSGIDTSGVSSFKAAVGELATVNAAGVVAAFSGASEQMASAGTSMINSLVSGMRSGIPSITTLVSDILNYSSSYIRSSTNKLILAGSTLAESIAKGVESKKNRIIMATSSCASGAATAIRGKYSEFVNAGSYLVEGFANGISANSFKAVATARAMAEAAISSAREALKINSPSKVFKAIGSGVPEGFAIGIGMLGGEVKQSVADMASTAIKSTRSAMSNILEAVSGDVDAQPTIRPVIDLTDVRSGANTIGSMFSDVQTVDVRSNLSAISSSMNARGQNGTNNDIISAINKLNDGLSSNRGDVYNFGDFTYDDGSNISDAVQTLVRAARVGRRV